MGEFLWLATEDSWGLLYQQLWAVGIIELALFQQVMNHHPQFLHSNASYIKLI